MSRDFYNNRQSYPYPKITPKDYFVGENVKENLFSEDADDIARSFQDGTKSSQVRKFYDEVLKRKMIIDFAKDKEMEFKKQLPYIKMIIAKANYGFNRKPRTVSKNFKSFLEENIGNIDNLKQFMVFCDLFEAVVAYTKGYLKD